MNSIGRVTFVSYDKLIFEVSNFEKLKYNLDGYSYIAKGVIDYVTIIDESNQKFIYQIIKSEDKEQILSKEENSKLDYTGKFDCIPIGVIRNNKIDFNLESYPFLNNKVYLTTEQEKEIIFSIDNTKHSIVLGHIEEKYQGKISLDKLFSHHGAVLGNTGSGKSNTVRQIISEVQKYKTENLYLHVFDVHDEYRQLVEKENNVDVLEDFQIELNSLELQDWINLVKPSDLVQLPVLQTALKISFLLSNNIITRKWLKCFLAHTMYNRVQTDAVAKRTKIMSILEGVDINGKKDYDSQFGNLNNFNETQFLDSLIQVMDSEADNHHEMSFLQTKLEGSESKVDSFIDLLEALDYTFLLEETRGNSQIRSHCGTLETRIKSIQVRYSVLLTSDTQEDIEYNQVTVYDVGRLDDDLLLFFSSYLLKNIFNKCKISRKSEEEIHVFIFEEAHRYISKEKESSAFHELELFKKIAREGRKFGTFLFLSSQRPSELSSTVLSQCNNYLIHRIKNNLDLEYMLKTIPYIDSNQLKRVSYLPTGRTFAVGELFPIPIEIQVVDRKDDKVSTTPSIKYN